MKRTNVNEMSGKKKFKTEMGLEAFKEMVVNAEMLDKKHLDYGPGNISRFGLRGIVVRMNDKIERLATLTDNNQIQTAQFESIEDTLRDLSNYATIGLLVQKGKWH
jgi:3-deoxy-D-manno-octulosonate 8-phosphate phosphatase KdsC-like HAD superfamily phosphatase